MKKMWHSVLSTVSAGSRATDIRNWKIARLWRVFATITLRKALRLLRDQSRLKRGGGEVRGDSAVMGLAATGDSAAGWDRIESADPSPDLAVIVNEECTRLLGLLDEAELQQIALEDGWRHQSRNRDEVRSVLATVERRLAHIRQIWSSDDPR